MKEITFDGEVFREIPSFPDYWVSKDGRIASSRSGNRKVKNNRFRLMKPSKVSGGYLAFGAKAQSGKRKHMRVHSAVLETWVGPRPEGMVCRHLDGARTNNNAENLAWGTHLENSDDKKKHGTMAVGERTKINKLTFRKVMEAREMASYMQAVEIAKIMNVKHLTIERALKGITWKHVPGYPVKPTHPSNRESVEFISPKGESFAVKNVKSFVIENPHLFARSCTVIKNGKNACAAMRGLWKVKRGKMSSWRGWRIDETRTMAP